VVNSERDRSAVDVLNDNRVGADPGMVANFDRSQDLCASTDVDMVANPGKPAPIPGSDRNLLKNKAIYANDGVGMNHDAVRMRDKKAPADIAVEGNIGASDDTPKTMAKDEPLSNEMSQKATFFSPKLVASDGLQ